MPKCDASTFEENKTRLVSKSAVIVSSVTYFFVVNETYCTNLQLVMILLP
jgi:hypothetical protein